MTALRAGARACERRPTCLVTGFIFLVFVGLLPLFQSIQELTRVQSILIYAMIGFGMNITFGYAGEFSVAQPVVFGTAAYTAAILNTEQHYSPWLTLPCALGAGILVNFLLSAPAFRLRGFYLAITTFFAAIVFPDIIDQFGNTTGGSNGIAGIGNLPGVGLVLGSSHAEYEIIFGIAIVLFLGMYNISRSTWGVTLRGIRDAPRAAEACGINVGRVKAMVSIVSAFPVSMAGWVYAHSTGTVATPAFGLQIAIVFLAGVILGGIGTVWGPFIGTIIIELVSLWIGPFSAYNPLFVGIAVLFLALAVPHGVVPGFQKIVARLASGPGAGARTRVTSRNVDLDASEEDHDLVFGHGEDRPATEQGEVIYEIRGVTKHFGGVSVLEGVDLEVRRGEVVGLIGPNGSGKTTLLNIITGHLETDGGEALLFGRSVLGKNPHTVADMGVRRSFQVPRLIGELSVLENVRLGLLGARAQPILGSIFRFPAYRARARADLELAKDACRLVGLPEAVWTRRIDGLPLGTRRIVEVARATVSGPAVICLDEPAAGLGGVDLARLGQVLRRVGEAGSGVLLIEHNLKFVRNITDRIVEMREGRVVSISNTEPASVDNRS